ncbi:ribonuclease H-like domain-containing protein [Tanacetum coccineum]
MAQWLNYDFRVLILSGKLEGSKQVKGFSCSPSLLWGTSLPIKYVLVIANEGEYVFSESVTSIPDAAISEAKISMSKPKSIGEPLIEDWIYDSEDENETEFKLTDKLVIPSSRNGLVSPSRDTDLPPLVVCKGNPQLELKEKGVIDNGCSRHMTKNKSYHSDYEEIDGGFVAFGGDPKGGRITGKGKISTCKLNFEDVYFVKELNYLIDKSSYGIKREFSVARTPQQNGVAERKNRTLIEAARTMLADSKLLTTFWAEAVNTAYYVQNRVLVIKPHNKTPYELFLGRKPALSFMRPFGCPITILNTLDHLGKFDGKADEGFFVGYSTNSKAYRVFNNRTRIVKENLHVKFSEETPNIAGNGLNWIFDIDALTISINYKPVVAGNQTNGNDAGTKENINAGQDGKKIVPDQEYILLPLLTSDPSLSKSLKDSPDVGFKPSGKEEKMDSEHS